MKRPWILEKTWSEKRHPARPSKLNLKVYNKYINKVKKRKNPKILILGSTPEIRDLVIKNGLIPTVVDISKEVYVGLTALMKERGKEKFIDSDWLEMPIDIKYDLVRGDTAINMLRWKDFEKFLIRIWKILKSDGFYVERIPVREGFQNEKEFLSKLEKARKLSKKFKKELVWILCYDAILFTYPRNKDEMCFERDFQKLKKLVKRGLMTEKEFKSMLRLAIPLRFCMHEKSEFEKLIGKYFTIQEMIRCNDVESHDFSPIFIMVKR